MDLGAGRGVAEDDPEGVLARSAWRTVRDGSSARTVPAPDDHGVALGPQAVGVGPGLGAGDPPAGPVGRGRPPVEGGGQLEDDVGPAGGAVLEVGGELGPDLVGADADVDLDAGGPQGGDAGAGHVGVGVLDADDDPGDARRRRWRRCTAGSARGGSTVRGWCRGWRRAAWSPAAARATISAWGPPGGWVAPSKPPGSITHPTHGFGDVDVRTPAASSIARPMAASSLVAPSRPVQPAGRVCRCVGYIARFCTVGGARRRRAPSASVQVRRVGCAVVRHHAAQSAVGRRGGRHGCSVGRPARSSRAWGRTSRTASRRLDRARGGAGGVEDEGGADGAGRGPGQAALVGVGQAHGLGQAGGVAVEDGGGALGREVAGPEAGAAGGDDQPREPVGEAAEGVGHRVGRRRPPPRGRRPRSRPPSAAPPGPRPTGPPGSRRRPRRRRSAPWPAGSRRRS